MTGKTMVMLFAALSASACSKEKPVADDATQSAGTVPIADARPLGDTALHAPPPPETVFVEHGRRAPRPARVPSPRLYAPPPVAAPEPAPPSVAPAPSAEPTPPPATVASLAAGTVIDAAAIDSIHSGTNAVGDLVQVRVGRDMRGADGTVVIPAGAVITLSIIAIAPAPGSGEKGTLALTARDVDIHGTKYPLSGNASDYQYEMKARPIGTSEVAKTGAGAVVGGVLGRLIGGNSTGTIVGAVGGAAAGAAVASKTATRDIIVHAGNTVTITVNDGFSRPLN